MSLGITRRGGGEGAQDLVDCRANLSKCAIMKLFCTQSGASVQVFEVRSYIFSKSKKKKKRLSFVEFTPVYLSCGSGSVKGAILQTISLPALCLAKLPHVSAKMCVILPYHYICIKLYINKLQLDYHNAVPSECVPNSMA